MVAEPFGLSGSTVNTTNALPGAVSAPALFFTKDATAT